MALLKRINSGSGDAEEVAANLTAHTGAASGVHGATGNVVGTSNAQTLTNKTISGAANTLSNIPQASVTSLTADLAAKASAAVTISGGDLISGGGDLSGNRTLTLTGATILVDLLSRDGEDSGLDADYLDGLQGSDYVTNTGLTATLESYATLDAPSFVNTANADAIRCTQFVSETGVAFTFNEGGSGGAFTIEENGEGTYFSATSGEINIGYDGSLLCISASQLGFFGVNPVSRQTATTDIKDALTNYGLLQGTSASNLHLDGGNLTANQITATNQITTATFGSFSAGNTISIRGASNAGTTTSISVQGWGSHAQTSGNVAQLAIIPTYNQTSGTASNTDLLINRTETAKGSGGQYLIKAQVASADKLYCTNDALLFIANIASAPGSNPSGGGYLYVESGALKYRGSSGTVTIIANA